MFKEFALRVLTNMMNRYNDKVLNTFKQFDFSSKLKNIDTIIISMPGDRLLKEITIRDSHTIEQIAKFLKERTDKWHPPALGTVPSYPINIRFYRNDVLITVFELSDYGLSYREKDHSYWFRTISTEEYESMLAICSAWL
jgi:hypothetical protein